MPSVFGRAGAPGKRSLTNCAKVCGVTSRILRLLVELDAMRVARPVRRRLAGVILGMFLHFKSIPAFYPMRVWRSEGLRATETDPISSRKSGRNVQSGCKSPQGVRCPSQIEEDSFNFGWRGEFGTRERLDRVRNQHPAFA